MTDQYVTVLAQFDDGDAANGYATGNYEWVAAGILQNSGAVGLATPIIIGQLDIQGSFSAAGIETPKSLYNASAAPNSGIRVLSSDSFAANELTWNLKMTVSGNRDNIIASNLIINYTSGASQGLFDILAANGYTGDAPARL